MMMFKVVGLLGHLVTCGFHYYLREIFISYGDLLRAGINIEYQQTGDGVRLNATIATDASRRAGSHIARDLGLSIRTENN